MATFADLPQEILPLILRNIRKYQDLAALVLVNKLHQVFAIPLLYEQIFIYPWHKNGKQRVHSVFQTLANSPQLASHVKRIEVRDFPRGLKGSARDDLLELCLRGLNNCVNLISCTWTRDGAMNTEVLCALRDCPSLQSLTINGQHQWKYDPNILSQFVNIQELSIIMPSPVIVHVIERAEYAKLTSLSLICKSSTVINDEFLSTLATKTPNIQRLQLINCPKVSDDGVMKVLEHSVPGLSDLAIEGTSGAFNLDRFGATVSQSQLLGNLRALTLTAPLHTGPRAEETLLDWFGALTTTLSSCSIERLHVYTSGDASRQNVPDTFVWSISDMHKSTLQRFSVHRMGVGLDAITYLASKCTKLEELFVTIPDNQLLDFGDSVSCSSSLRHIHLNITTSDGQSPMVVMRNVATDVVRKCGPSVVQFGCSTRVWQVVRTVQRNEQGELEVERTLGPYEAPEIPEQFLVVRA